MNEKEKQVIRILNDDFPLVSNPWQEMAKQAGMEWTEFLSIAKNLKEKGIIRRFGAVLRHRAVGFSANALYAGAVPTEKIDAAGKVFAADDAVTHCYSRRMASDWAYNFYAMFHASNRDELIKLAETLSADCGISDWKLLFTTKEWKKESLRYFE